MNISFGGKLTVELLGYTYTIKMVTKDWRIETIPRNKISPKIKEVVSYRNIKDGNFIHIISFKYRKGWEFRTLLISDFRYFKTKLEAIKHAKMYMTRIHYNC